MNCKTSLASVVISLLASTVLLHTQNIYASEPNTHHFKKIMIVLLENEDYEEVLGKQTTDYPGDGEGGPVRKPTNYFSELVKMGALLSNYHGVAHPSQPNYIALTAGDTEGVTDDDAHLLDARHIGDLLDAQHKSWKSYAEGFPGHCGEMEKTDPKTKKHLAVERLGAYTRKHVPFLSYKNIAENTKRCDAHVVNATQLYIDLQNNNLPDYSFYTPDMNNDGHDTNVRWSNTWIRNTFFMTDDYEHPNQGPTLQGLLKNKNFMKDMLIVFTFDESGVTDPKLRKGDPNKVFAVLVGDGIKPGVESTKDYSHYSLLRTVEANFDLGNLGKQDAKASLIDDIWSR